MATPACRNTTCVHAEVAELQRRSTTVLFTFCINLSGNVSRIGGICSSTWPRWTKYASLHGYDTMMVQQRTKTITGIASIVWIRCFVAHELFTLKGYDQVFHVDGDTAVVHWEYSLQEYLGGSNGPFANLSQPLPGHSSPFLYLSRDEGRWGRYEPTKRDFASGISLNTGGLISGPNNFGVFLMKRAPAALAALEHLMGRSQTLGRHFQGWPAEQGVLNAWLGQNCTRALPRGAHYPPSVRVHKECYYAQAEYGTFQSFYRAPVQFHKNATLWHAALLSLDAGLNSTLHRLYSKGAFILHTPSMAKIKALDDSSLAERILRYADELWPVQTSKTLQPLPHALATEPLL